MIKKNNGLNGLYEFIYMKVTLIKTTKKNKQMAKLMTLDETIKAISEGKYAAEVSQLYEFMYTAGSYSRYTHMHRLPVVYPSAEMKVDEDGNNIMMHFNGLLTLTVGKLHEREEAEAVKRVATMLPSTVAVVKGSSGMSIKIVVAVSRPDNMLPQTEDEAEAFCQQAYPILCRFYEVALSMAPAGNMLTIAPAIRGDETSLLHAGFRMTWDKEVIYRPIAMPLTIPAGIEASETPRSVSAETGEQKSGVGEVTRQLMQMMAKNYAFRMNTVMGYVEYRSKHFWHRGWQPVDERMQNSLSIEAREEGLNVWDKDITRYLKSKYIPTYDPIDEYLWQLHNKWDGKDHIGRLARTVPTDNEHWPEWFRTWFLGMVAQWMGKNRRYGNAIAPLLISKQAYNKSTFCRSLLPPELQWGYTDNLVLSEKKSVLQAMSQFLLINLDEFNQISPKVQEGFLKNLIQLSSVKVKRPYGKHVEDFPRLASFIATANVTDLLADPTGNRRFIGIELTGPINVKYRINYQQLYAQALALLDQGVPYWLDEEQTRMVMQSNLQFQLRSPEETYFFECFAIADDENEGQWMSAANILHRLKQYAGAAIHGDKVRNFGRFLANLEGLSSRRTRFGAEYLVKTTKK